MLITGYAINIMQLIKQEVVKTELVEGGLHKNHNRFDKPKPDSSFI
jgi:hypothetical protein